MMAHRQIDLSHITEEKLLERRVAELPLSIGGTWLEECVFELYRELDSRGIRFRPECYLADEWLTPDREPVIGIPFFLAHPALIKLERKMMFEVEGGTNQWCMKLLRHETGHAVNYAYRLYKRKKWHKIFGPFSAEYGDTYHFRPYSKSFVRHLEKHYAQYHPDEDFAETFAVWLTPGSDWQAEYRGWKAAEKLLYVDSLMREIKDKEPQVKSGKKYWQASRLRIMLKNYYKKKRDFWAEEFPDFHDAYLKKIFAEKDENVKNSLSAAKFLKKYRRTILDNVADCTGERKFIINDLLRVLIGRCGVCRLYVSADESAAIARVVAYVTSRIMNYIYTGQFKG